MNDLILIKVNGMLTRQAYNDFRKQKIKELKEGLLIQDETINEIMLVHANELGIDIKEVENEKESI